MVIFVSLAYTMFNVYLPKLLETRSSPGDGGVPKSLTDSLWDVVIYSVGGCPGAIVSLTPILNAQWCPHVRFAYSSGLTWSKRDSAEDGPWLAVLS